MHFFRPLGSSHLPATCPPVDDLENFSTKPLNPLQFSLCTETDTNWPSSETHTMPLDKAANLFSILEELEAFLANAAEGPSSLAEKARSRPELLEWLLGASADHVTAKTDADASRDIPRYGGLFGRIMEQLRLDTEYWRAISEQSTPQKGRSESSNAWIARKWVHGAMVPCRLNYQRLWDPLEIVFDPSDGSFAVLNRNLLSGKLSLSPNQ